MKRKHLQLSLTLMFICTAFLPEKTVAQSTSKTIVVDPAGKDGGAGTPQQPSSITAAFSYLNTSAGNQDVVISLHSGTYHLAQSLAISVRSSVRPKSVTIQKFDSGKVIIEGGLDLAGSAFTPATADDFRQNGFPENGKGRIYKVSSFGTDQIDLGILKQRGAHATNQDIFMVYEQNVPMTLARWPNSGQTPIQKVLNPGGLSSKGQSDGGAVITASSNRCSRWTHEPSMWLNGYFSYGFTDDNIEISHLDLQSQSMTLKQSTGYGVFSTSDSSTPELKNAMGTRGFYVYNVPEELDTPGEWYLNKTARTLYVWPGKQQISDNQFSIPLLQDPLLILSNISNVTINGIDFTTSRGMGILLERTNKISILNCTFSNLGLLAIATGNENNFKNRSYLKETLATDTPSYNQNLLVKNCRIENTGTGGITLEGGNRKTLARGNNRVVNCSFENYSMFNKTYSPAVYLDGVGNEVSHCLIHNSPDQAIIFQGNDHIIQFNKIESVGYFGTDQSAVYTGRDPSAAGTVIKNNLFSNITSRSNGSLAAIYFDDGAGGDSIVNNIFYKAGFSGCYGFGAVYLNGGANTSLTNNYFIQCGKALSDAAWTDKQWNQFIARPDIVKKLNADVDIHSSAFQRSYPKMRKLIDSVSAPRKNNCTATLAYNVSTFSTAKSITIGSLMEMTTDPGFVDLKNEDFRLKSIPANMEAISGWTPIESDIIGLKK